MIWKNEINQQNTPPLNQSEDILDRIKNYSIKNKKIKQATSECASLSRLLFLEGVIKCHFYISLNKPITFPSTVTLSK